MLRKAWGIYDRWLEDPRVEFYPEPRNLDAAFREGTQPFAAQAGSKAVGDCFLLAYAKEVEATLVTFDRGLHEFARRQNYAAIVPA
jgi:predicted nucleic acid-binding protein